MILPDYAGVYNEKAFAGLDSVIDTAAQYGIRLIMTMADYWLSVDSFNNVGTPPDINASHACSLLIWILCPKPCKYQALPFAVRLISVRLHAERSFESICLADMLGVRMCSMWTGQTCRATQMPSSGTRAP